MKIILFILVIQINSSFLHSKNDPIISMIESGNYTKAIDELNGATVQGRAIVVNKSEPKPEGERRSFNSNSRGGDSRGGYGGGNSRGGNDRGGNRGGY